MVRLADVDMGVVRIGTPLLLLQFRHLVLLIGHAKVNGLIVLLVRIVRALGLPIAPAVDANALPGEKWEPRVEIARLALVKEEAAQAGSLYFQMFRPRGDIWLQSCRQKEGEVQVRLPQHLLQHPSALAHIDAIHINPTSITVHLYLCTPRRRAPFH